MRDENTFLLNRFVDYIFSQGNYASKDRIRITLNTELESADVMGDLLSREYKAFLFGYNLWKDEVKSE